MAVDTSGDGFNDLVDPKPTQDSSPIEVIVEMNAEGQVVVQASGPARLDEVAARGYYTFPEDSAGWTQWKLVETDLEQVEGSWGRTAIFEPHLAEDMIPPAAVQFNVSDARGQSQSIRLAAAAYSESDGQSLELNAVDDDGLLDGFIDWVTGDAKLFVATLFVASTVTVPAGGTLGVAVNPKVLAGIGLIIAIGAAVKYYDDLPNPDWVVEEFAKTTILAAPLTTTVAVATTTDGVEVTIPEGLVYDERGAVRGYGLKYIKQTTGLTTEEVVHAIQTGKTVYKDGTTRLVIGERVSEDGKTILKIIGGILVAGEVTDHNIQGYEMDPCGDIVWFREHAVADKKPINDIDKLKKYFRNNIKKVYRGPGGKKYYVIKIAEDAFITLVSQPVGSLKDITGLPGRLLMTMLTGSDGGFYDDLEDAEDDIPEDAKETEPGNC